MFSLRRITSATQYIPEIDGLRCFAIVSVILFHIYGSLGHNGAFNPPSTSLDLHRLSKRGVELFFAISGFVLALPFAKAYRANKSRPILKDYLLRRVTRLEPPYILALLICGAALYLTHTETLSQVAPHFLASSLYMHYFTFGAESTIISPAWSLEVEVQFYLLVPLLTLVFSLPGSRRRAALLASTLIASFSTIWGLGTVIEPTILYYLPFFLAGFVAVDDYLDLRQGQSQLQKAVVWDITAIVLLGLLWVPFEKLSHVLLPFALIVIFRATFRSKFLSLILSSAVLTTIGGMCYTIYLYHVLLIAGIGRVTKPLHFGSSFAGYFLLQAAIMLPVILLISAGLFLLIERPCMDRNWPKRLYGMFTPAKIGPSIS